MNTDVFISYSSKDSNKAIEVCNYLELAKLRCWIAPRDVVPGFNYAEGIVSSIKNSKLFLLVLTSESSISRHVANEVDCAFTNNIPIVTFKIGSFIVSDALGYYLNRLHWLNAGENYSSSFDVLLLNCKRLLGVIEKPNGTAIEFTDGSNLTVNIKGEMHYLANSFNVFKDLLNTNEIDSFSINQKTYRVSEMNEYIFGLLTGSINYNQHLTKTLIEVSVNDCVASRRFRDRVLNTVSWEAEKRISDKAKEIISYSFVGVIGKEFGRLMAIGKENYSEEKYQKYVEKCFSIIKYTLDLINYALLSVLWDYSQNQEIELNSSERDILTTKFDSPFEPYVLDQFKLLNVLVDIFNNPKNNFELPLPELNRAFGSDECINGLYGVCESVSKLKNKRYDVADCWKMELNLCGFFKYFSFLTSYQMASIKKIGYRQIKNYKPGFVHRYIALGIDNKANVDAEKVDYEDNATYSDSVLLFKGDDFKKSINLFPFVLDYNAISLEQGAKICFFSCLPFEKGTLEYTFIDDNSSIRFEKRGMMDDSRNINDLLLNDENVKSLNVECAVDRFFEARRSILREIDFNDL